MKKLDIQDFDFALNEEGYALIDFSASWCMPCKMLKPILEEMETKNEKVKFYFVDIDESEELAKRFRIFSVPTLILFKNGEKIDQSIGLINAEELRSFIDRNVF